MNSAPDIFVSYASQDRERVRELVTQLEGNGWRIWWDRQIKTGTMFDREIEKAIHSASCILVIWSHASVESEWVRTEANEGLDRGILIPVAIDNVRPPLAYRRVQTNLLLGWPEGSHKEELVRLIAGISHLLRSKAPAAVPADEDIAGERRNISAVTGRITEHLGHSDPEKSDEMVQLFNGAVVELARKFGGYLYENTGGSFLVVFGVPSAHEKDSLLAVTFALRLQERLREIVAQHSWAGPGAFTVESSVTSGLVVARKVKARETEYSITGGSVIDQGAKLLAAVPANEILATSEVHDAIASYVEAEPLVEGNRRLYRIRSASAITSPIEAAEAKGLTDLCGREAEIAQVLERLALATDGSGQVVTLAGEAGIGKSRVIHEIRRRLPARNCVVWNARCHSYGSSTPYYPFLGLLRECLGVGDRPAAEAHDFTVGTILAIDPDLRLYLPHFLYLLSISSDEHVLPKHVEGESKRLALQEALVALLAAAARGRTLVITFEDWHWADDASTAVLSHLIDVAASFSMLLLISCRPEFRPGWGAHEHCSVLKLTGFSAATTREMIASTTGATEVPAELVADLHQRTLGNPFFIEEVCRSLLERGKLSVHEGRLLAPDGIELLGVPGSVQAVLRARLDLLDRETQEIVHCAAVIGREFSRKLLEVTCGRIVDPVLRALVEIGILRQVRVVPEAEYIFKHALIQVVAYETLLVKARRKLHRLVGENIISLYPDGLAERTEMLAYHFGLSDDVDRAIHFAIQAGERALARSAHLDATKHLKAAERLVEGRGEDPSGDRARLRIALLMGPALVVSEGYSAPAVIESYQRARELSRRLGAADEEFAALWGVWRYCNSSALMEEAREYAHQLLEIARKNGRTDQLHSAYAAVAGSETFQGNLRQAQEAVGHLRATYREDTQYELAMRFGTAPMVVGLGISANAMVLAGNYEAAIATAQEGLAVARKLKHPAAEVTALFYEGNVQLLGGNLAEANRANRRLLEIAEAERLPQWITQGRFSEARANLLAGAGSGSMAEKLADLVAKANQAAAYTPAAVTTTRMSLATICVAVGQRDMALGFIAEGMRALRIFRPEFLRLKARALKDTDPVAAAEALDSAWSLAVAMEANVWKLRILLDRAQGAAGSSPAAGELVPLLKTTIDSFTGSREPAELSAARRFLESMPKPA